MKLYELTYLISPDLSAEKAGGVTEKINSFIQKEGGFLNKVNQPVKKKLAYPIKKYLGAFFASLDFYLTPEKLVSLEKNLKTENQILRYFILTKKTPTKVMRKERLPKKVVVKPKAKVELKEIEKKLEEILGET